jgi:S1-C subfamily serine protease
VLVTAVAPGGPAATAGIIGGSRSATVYGTTVCTGGDVITQIGSTTINSMTDLQTLLESQSIGAALPTKIVHANGVHATVTITLRKQPSNAPSISSTC